MLAAVVNAASTLKAARIIVEVLTDLLSANTRLAIKDNVAFDVLFVDVSTRGVVYFKVPLTTLSILPISNLAFTAMIASTLCMNQMSRSIVLMAVSRGVAVRDRSCQVMKIA